MSSRAPWSFREVFGRCSIAGNLAEFSVVEFPVPQGWKFLLRGFEVSQACLVGVLDVSNITTALATSNVLAINPFGLVPAFVGRRPDAGVLGYVARTISGFQAYNWDVVIDGMPGQRLSFIGQTVNTALEVSFTGKLVEESFDAQFRTLV